MDQPDAGRSNPFGVARSEEQSEGSRFSSALRKCLIRNRGFADLEPDRVLAVYEHCLLGTLDESRRYGLELPSLTAFSGQTIRCLQAEVLNEFSEWTLVISGGEEEPREIEVTRDAVRCEAQGQVSDVDTFMTEVKAIVGEWRYRTEGSYLRQLNYLRPRIPDVVKQVTDETPCVIIGMFDNYRGRRDRISVWALANADNWSGGVPGVDGVYAEGLPLSDSGIAYSHRYDGEMYDTISSSAKVWLVASFVPASYLGELLEFEGPRPWPFDGTPGKKVLLRFDRSTLVHDSELPRVELP